MPDLARMKDTAYLWGYTLLRIPMIAFLRPVVVEMSDRRCEIRIPLAHRTRNHLNSMYFGVLCAGADCAGGLVAFRQIQKRGNTVAFVFKDFHAEFLKRAEGDVVFCCEQGEELIELVRRAEESGERVEDTIHVTATVPSKLGDEPVARFRLTISLKGKSGG
jgi:acyl-coenzyme A thioesterase PaaI-like protein